MVQQPIIFSSSQPPRRTPWMPVLLTGVLIAVVGVGLIIWPFLTARWILATLVGAAFISGGLAVLARAGRAPGAMFGAAVLICIGVLSILVPGAIVGALIGFAGVGLIVLAVLWAAIVSSFAATRRPGAYLPSALLLAGGLIAVIWPAVALAIVAVIGGVVVLGIGILTIRGAIRLRQYMRTGVPPKRWPGDRSGDSGKDGDTPPDIIVID